MCFYFGKDESHLCVSPCVSLCIFAESPLSHSPVRPLLLLYWRGLTNDQICKMFYISFNVWLVFADALHGLYRFVYLCLLLHIFECLVCCLRFVNICLCLALAPTFCMGFNVLLVFVCVCLCVFVCVSLCVSLCVCLSVCVSLSLCLSLYASLCVSLSISLRVPLCLLPSSNLLMTQRVILEVFCCLPSLSQLGRARPMLQTRSVGILLYIG